MASNCPFWANNPRNYGEQTSSFFSPVQIIGWVRKFSVFVPSLSLFGQANENASLKQCKFPYLGHWLDVSGPGVRKCTHTQKKGFEKVLSAETSRRQHTSLPFSFSFKGTLGQIEVSWHWYHQQGGPEFVDDHFHLYDMVICSSPGSDCSNKLNQEGKKGQIQREAV